MFSFLLFFSLTLLYKRAIKEAVALVDLSFGYPKRKKESYLRKADIATIVRNNYLDFSPNGNCFFGVSLT